MSTEELPAFTPLPKLAPAVPVRDTGGQWGQIFWQFVRFALVGCLNTLVDLLVLNALLRLWPAQSIVLLLLANSLAYTAGAINSFLLNRYWTFQCTGCAWGREFTRFAVTTLAGIVCNDLILGLLTSSVHPDQFSPALWTNGSKIVAIACTIFVSYLWMRLWVFVHSSQETPRQTGRERPTRQRERHSAPLSGTAEPTGATGPLTTASLTLVLPAYNEEQIIAATVKQALHGLEKLVGDFEIIVVNDGSSDGTGTILADLSAIEPRLRVVTHQTNLGYGATLADGFATASKELTFFMDSDGQFAIHDLARLLPFIDEYDAVVGHRLKRQDTWTRKLNAWGWKQIVRLVLGVRVRDIDCAFKVLRTSFLHSYPLETRGAMINAELLYKLKRAGYTVKEVGVSHLPRQGGCATGANLHVIGRAFRELFLYSSKWRRAPQIAQDSSSPTEEIATAHAFQEEDLTSGGETGQTQPARAHSLDCAVLPGASHEPTVLLQTQRRL